jgi:hypothetical protein
MVRKVERRMLLVEYAWIALNTTAWPGARQTGLLCCCAMSKRHQVPAHSRHCFATGEKVIYMVGIGSYFVKSSTVQLS